ncbi:MAG TPA: EsaB/YukD family protein [Blastocatellia bacterium]|jgi:hypothetical protein|nr:EsaB/YukD family protein [Blastocatellia bacterium]
MPLLNIDLMTPDGILFEGNEIPDDLQSGELTSRLVNTLSLPRATAGGEVIRYSLEIVNQGVRLQSGQTLGEAGATNGDVIRLLSSHKIQKSSELKTPQTPVVTDYSPPDDAPTASTRNGAVIIIPVRGSNASVNKILGRLKDNLGIRPEDFSVLNASASNLNAPVSAALQPSRPGVFGKYRTATLAVMGLISFLFLILAISSKNKTESIAQAKEPSSALASIPSPTPTPEPTPEPTVEPTPAPTPEMVRESISRQSLTQMSQTKVMVTKGVKIEQTKPARVITAQNPPVKLPEAPKSSSLVVAQNAPGKMPEMSNAMPKVVAQDDPSEIPDAPAKKCGMFRKMLAGCKNKQPKKSKRGGAVGVAESAAESRAKSTIRRGAGKAIPIP